MQSVNLRTVNLRKVNLRKVTATRWHAWRPGTFAALRSVAAIAAVAVVVGVIVFARSEPATSVGGITGTTWLSAEQRGRVVLASPRAERPSLSVELVEGSTEFDLVEVGRVVLIHDRIDGTVVVLDAARGTEIDRLQGPRADGERPVLVAAGDGAYVVDRSARSVQRIEADGSVRPRVQIAADLEHWVGTADGLLWAIDDSGTLWSTDGGRPDSRSVPGLGAGPWWLSSIGSDPVVFDASTGRLSWPRRERSVSVPGAGADRAAVVQEPSSDASCAVVLTASVLSCVGPDEVVRSVANERTPVLGPDAVLLAGTDLVVLATRSSDEVNSFDWSGRVGVGTRPSPTDRIPTGRTVGGAVLVDDPGSQYAVTVTMGATVTLDKLSRRTVVLNPDGTEAGDGIGTTDEDADVAGAVEVGDAAAEQTDDDGINDPPAPRPDRAVTRAGRTVVVDVLANDGDADGDPLRVVGAESPSSGDGEVSVVGGARVRYVPPAESENRTMTFGYRVADPSNAEGSSTVSVDIIGDGSNTPPVAVDDEATTRTGVPVVVDVLANDRDGEGDPMVLVSVDGVANGSLAVENGRVRYEPEVGFVGSERLQYRVSDGFGGSAEATIEIEVIAADAVNRPPVAVDDRVSVRAGSMVRFDPRTNDRDPDGDRLNVVGVTALPGVSIRIVGSQVEVIAGDDVEGLLVFGYTIADPDGLRDTAQVGLVVTRPQPLLPPTAIDDRASSSGQPVTIDLVANDEDPSGGQLVIRSFTQPIQGLGTVSSVSATAVRFVPAGVGTATFTYTVENSLGLTASARVTVDVSPPNGSGPVAADDRVQVFVGQVALVPALANDSHPGGLPISYSGAPSASVGTVRITASGDISFTPPAGVGTYLVRYRIVDPVGRSASAQIVIDVIERPISNLAPVALGDVRAVDPGGVVDIDVVANDEDPERGPLRLVGVGTPNFGDAVVVGGLVRYTAPRDRSGVAQFTYTVADDAGAVATGTVTVQVAARAPEPPVAVDDLLELTVGQTGTVRVLTNDTDPDGDRLALSIRSLEPFNPGGGPTASIAGRNVTVVAGSVVGSFTTSYQITDADGLSAVGRLTVVVVPPPNSPPRAVNDAYFGLALPFLFRVTDNDIDPDGGSVVLAEIVSVSPASAGTASIIDNAISFVPSPTFNGAVVITYGIRDGQGATATGRLTATLSACPALPAVGNITVATPVGVPVDVALLPSPVADVDVSLSEPTSGSVSLDASGVVARFTPDLSGTTTFSYTVTTSCDARATRQVTVRVGSPPVAEPDRFATRRNVAIVLDVLRNDTDADGESIRVDTVTSVSGGSVNLVGGQLRFTPTTGFVGTASFTYRIRDAGGMSSTAAEVVVEVGNAPPVAVPDTTSMPQAAARYDLMVLINDDDPDGDALQVVAVSAIEPSGAGTLSIGPGGAYVTVRLDPRFGPGTFGFTYTVSDGASQATARVTVDVTNAAPVAEPDSAELDLALASSITVRVLDNDSDPDGSNAELVLVRLPGDPAGASIVGRRIRYEPPPGTEGDVRITYVVRDADGEESTGILTVSVIAVPVTTPPTTGPPPTDPPPTDPPPTDPPPPEGTE